jgi:FAD/FMN-containing dehydrogenase
VTWDLRIIAGITHWHSFMREAAERIHSYGGSLSGEHDDGQSKAEFLPVMYGAAVVEAFGAFKRLWDPTGHMNPGKMVDPDPIDSNLCGKGRITGQGSP